MTTHPEIDVIARRVLEMFAAQRAYLNSKPTPFLDELQHRCEELLTEETFTQRTAAEINRAACVLILEERKSKP